MGPGKKLVRRNYSNLFHGAEASVKKRCFSPEPFDVLENQNPHYLVFPTSQSGSDRVGGEGLRIQSQEGQELCGTAAEGNLMFKTCTEDQTVDLTNKGMTKDSPRFSRWFHSAWRTTGPIQYSKFREPDLAIIS